MASIEKSLAPQVNGARAQRVDHSGERVGADNTFHLAGVQPDRIVIVVTTLRGGRYEARLENAERVLCGSRHPFVDAARVLIVEGFDPTTVLVMRRVGSDVDALCARLGIAAKLRARETGDGPPRFVLWRAFSADSGSPTIAPHESHATPDRGAP